MIFDTFPSSKFLTTLKSIAGPILIERTKTLTPDSHFYDLLLRSYKDSNDNLKANKHWQEGESSLIDIDSLSDKTNLHSAFVKMLDPWIGVTGLSSVSIKEWTPYKDLIQSLLPNETSLIEELDTLVKQKAFLVTDLGTIFDFLMIYPFLCREGKPLNVVEVGGGYGRLALMLSAFPGAVSKYVMIDAVPSSLYFSYLLLKATFPDKVVGSPILGDKFESCDFWICPSWQLSSVPTSTFDLSINVESMQEMDQHHIDFYLNGFNSWVKDGGVIYLSNSKDYVFKGEWNIPKLWDLILTERGPRAWTKNHPTECYIKKINENDPLKLKDLELVQDLNLALARHKQILTIKIEKLELELQESRAANEVARQEPPPPPEISILRKVINRVLGI